MNKQKYKITSILHSGRKGLRNMPVTNPKYNGIVGSIVTLYATNKLEDFRQFEDMRLEFIKTDTDYEFWHTSPIISIGTDTDGGYVVETVNTIYYMKGVNDWWDL